MRTMTLGVRCTSYGIAAGMITTAAMLQADTAHRVKVTIIQHETSVRTSLSNHDAYLATIQTKSGRTFEAKIIDEYPGYAEGSVRSDIVSFSAKLDRAPYCDVVGGEAEQEMRCFKIVRGTLKSASTGKPADTWWK